VRHELEASDPERARTQHRRAARWFETTGDAVPAVRHATQAGDFDGAARLLALNAVSLTLRGRVVEWRKLLEVFPQDMLAEDPRLLLAQAISAAFGFDADRIEALSRRASAGLSPGTDLEARRLRAVSDLVETVAARVSGRPAEVLTILAPEGPNIPGIDDSGFDRMDLDLRALWWSTRAVALLWENRRDAALAEAELARRDARAGAARWPLVTALSVQALGQAMDGHLVAASRLLEELAPHLHEAITVVTPSVVLADAAAVWVALERADLAAADNLLRRAEVRWPQLTATAAGAALRILRARLTLLQGRPLEAAEQLDSVFAGALQLRRGLLEHLEAWVRVEIMLGRGDVDAARDAARRGSPELRAYVEARAGERPAADMAYGDRELGLQLRTLLALGVNLHGGGRRAAADSCLDAALDLTAAEKYRLPFLQLGARLHGLLIDAHLAAARHGTLVAELLRLTVPTGGRGVELAESLSPRELDVLRHLVAGLHTDEIAGDLYLSRHTIRTHTKSIYRKLSVQNKRDAVLRAAALGIV
jgi:LuxR family transcriptional regulator, maltose regulon positive regulatory protein